MTKQEFDNLKVGSKIKSNSDKRSESETDLGGKQPGVHPSPAPYQLYDLGKAASPPCASVSSSVK